MNERSQARLAEWKGKPDVMGIVFESALAARFVRPDKLNAETERAGTLLRRFLADADSFAPFRGWVDPDAAAGPLSAVKAKAAEIRENADVFVLTGTPGAELERLATANGNLFLAFPETVGGRYSATSPVGLFPMAAAGLDIDRLLAGARDLANLLAAGGGAFDMAAAYAGLRHALFGEGFVVDRLDEYHFGQLFQFFLAACTASALLLGVHPFTQDGVEEYKNRMFAALEKPL